MNSLQVIWKKAIYLFLMVVGLAFQAGTPAAATSPSHDARGDFVGDSAARKAPTVWGGPTRGAGFRLTVGDYYATASDRADILQVNPRGEVVASLQIPGFTDGFKGTAFGPDGRLYVVAVADLGYEVLVLEDDGSVVRRYQGTDYVFGNLSFGKIAVSRDTTLYVGGQNVLRRFSRHGTTGEVIFEDNQVYDVDILPNGNLAVLTAYDLVELTNAGSFVRDLAPMIGLTDARGVLFNPASNDFYVTMLGSSGNFFSLMRLDAATGNLELNQTFTYADDLTLTAEGGLLVGSRTQAPGFFTTDLAPNGVMATDPRMFVTRMPEPLHRFADGFE
ncbi:MAG: hypothetical protein ACT4NL_08475 [Pseudomarimonas sp.]